MSYLISKLSSPFSLARRVIWKLIVGPFKYRGTDGYDAERYWSDRHDRFGLGYRGSGDEGLSEDENRAIYEAETRGFAAIAQRHGVDLKGASVLDIGCGAGVYTELCATEQVAEYTGVDITDVLFDGLKEKYPDYSFVKLNAATESLDTATEDMYDAVICISVIIHVTRPRQLERLLNNCVSALKPDGVFFLSPVVVQDSRAVLSPALPGSILLIVVILPI
jgi:2-polyprenyl-3-methyl-5-hydroxy-6-metoxy-1,4-benzoquinol methylase